MIKNNQKSMKILFLVALTSFPIFSFSAIAKIFFIKIIFAFLLLRQVKISYVDALVGSFLLGAVILFSVIGLSEGYNLRYWLMELSSFVVIASIILISRIHKRECSHDNEYDLLIFTYQTAKYVLILILLWGIINIPLGNTYLYNDWGVNRLYMGMGAASLGIYSALTAAMLYEVYLRHETSSLLVVLLIIAITLCLASGARTPLAALLLIIIFSSIKQLKVIKLLIIAIILSVLIYYFGAGTFERFDIDLEDLSSLKNISSSGRFALWDIILTKTSALGQGFGSGITFAVDAGAIIGYSEDQPHSELVRFYSIFGVFGFVLYLVIGTFLFVNVLHAKNLSFGILFLISLTDNIFVYWHVLFIALIPFLMSSNRKLGY